MISSARGLTLCCGMVAALLATPAESHALCGLFDWWGGCCGRTTYRPYCGNACSPCGTTVGYGGYGGCGSSCGFGGCGSSCGYGGCGSSCSPCGQTCNYVPQTCYRTECVNVPVTTFRCVSSCDPCTGCPVNTMQPVTSFMRQVRYVPMTSYRPVCSPCAAPAAVAPAIAAPAMVAPAIAPTTTFSPVPAAVAPGAPGCCSPTATSTFAAPTTTYMAPHTGYSVPGMTGAVVSPPVVPPPPVAVPVTPPPATITPLPTVPSNGSGSWTYDPNSRTTRLPSTNAPRPIEDKSLVVPAVYATSATKTLDDSGWHAARR